MAEEEAEPNPIEQLVEILVYAPVGLLYEYQEVIPQLVKRGKSQVQLAKVLGQMAMRARSAESAGASERSEPERRDPGADLVNVATDLIARAVTEFGAAVGLAPDRDERSGGGRSAGDRSGSSAEPASAAMEEASPELPPAPPLPIATYDSLTAREIIPLLEALSSEQRQVVRAHEEAGRARKTVLAKLDRLDS